MTKQQLEVLEKRWSIYPTSVEEARRFIKRTTSAEQSARATRLILSSYPQSVNNVANEECYATQVTALLATYPPEIVQKLASPVSGIVGKSTWLPSVAELKKEADSLMYTAKRMVEIRDSELKQISERV